MEGGARGGWVGEGWGVVFFASLCRNLYENPICRSPLTNKLSYIYKAKSDDKI